MNLEFLFGAGYEFAQGLPERMQLDFQMMQEAGMNLVRILEPHLDKLEGEIEKEEPSFTSLDAVLNEAHKAGLFVILGLPIRDMLRKAGNELKSEMRGEIDEERSEGISEGISGRRPGAEMQEMNLLCPAFRKSAGELLEAFIARTAEHPAVIGWQIGCGQGDLFDLFDSRHTREKFADFLKLKFGQIKALNDAYGLSFLDFSDVQGGFENGFESGLAEEYMEFLQRQAEDFLDWEAASIRKMKKPGQFISSSLDLLACKSGRENRESLCGIVPGRVASACASRTCIPGNFETHAHGYIRPLAAAKNLDFCGTSICHPSQDELTGREIAMSGDQLRSLRDSSYLLLETDAQGESRWTPYPGQLTLQLFSHIASGAMGLSYWNWLSPANGVMTFRRGVLGHDLHKNRFYREIAAAGQEIRHLWPRLRGLYKDNRIAILVSDACRIALNEIFPIDPAFRYDDAVKWVYDALYDLNLECDFLYDTKVLEDPELITNYDLLIAPALYTVSDELISILRAYTGNGGTLLASFRSFFADEHLTVRPNLQPCHMIDVFGAFYQEYTCPGSMMKVGGHRVEYLAELLQSSRTEGMEVLACYDHPVYGGCAAAVENPFFEGHAFYIGSCLAREELEKILLRAAEKAGIRRPDAVFPLIIRSGISMTGKTLHFVLCYAPEETDWISPWDALELRSGQLIQAGDLVHLKAWDVRILEEK